MTIALPSPSRSQAWGSVLDIYGHNDIELPTHIDAVADKSDVIRSYFQSSTLPRKSTLHQSILSPNDMVDTAYTFLPCPSPSAVVE
jgi:hypothetical protein